MQDNTFHGNKIVAYLCSSGEQNDGEKREHFRRVWSFFDFALNTSATATATAAAVGSLKH